MPTLREIVDQTTISAAAPKASNPSPVAQHISNHMQDPVGATKDGFGKLTTAKLQYDQAREEMQRNLAPVQSVINHVSMMHNLDPHQDMNSVMPGMAGNPDNTGVPGVPNGNGDEALDEDGNPLNMSQTVGKMNQSRPSLVGHQPGVAPGDGQTVRPPKLGMATPGQPNAQNSPQPKGSGNAQFGPAAAKPKGAGKLPGAKGPGDPKVANRTKKAQNGGSGKAIGKGGGVNVTVHASDAGILLGSRNRISEAAGLGMLRTMSAGPAALEDKSTNPENEVAYNPKFEAAGMKCKACGKMHAEGKCMKGAVPGMPGAGTHGSSRPSFDAGGPGSGRKPEVGSRVTIDKPYGGGKGTVISTSPSGSFHTVQMDKGGTAIHHESNFTRVSAPKMDAAGTRKGAKHRLSTKGQKNLSKKEKMAHWDTLDAGKRRRSL